MKIDIKPNLDYGDVFECDGEMIGTISQNPIGWTVWIPDQASAHSTARKALAKLFPGLPSSDLSAIYDAWMGGDYETDYDAPRHCWVGSVLEVA